MANDLRRHQILWQPAAIVLIATLGFGWIRPAQAQQEGKIAKIGWITNSAAATENVSEVLRQELNKLGYVEA